MTHPDQDGDGRLAPDIADAPSDPHEIHAAARTCLVLVALGLLLLLIACVILVARPAIGPG